MYSQYIYTSGSYPNFGLTGLYFHIYVHIQSVMKLYMNMNYMYDTFQNLLLYERLIQLFDLLIHDYTCSYVSELVRFITLIHSLYRKLRFF